MQKFLLNKIPVTIIDFTAIDYELTKMLSSGGFHQIVTFNSLMYIEALRNPDFLKALLRSDIILPESSGVAWAIKFLYNIKIQYLAGIDLVYRIFALSHKEKLSLYLLGAKPDVIRRACEKIKSMFPGISIVGCRDGYFSESESQDIIRDISSSGADILLVGLGIPKQEIWISRNKQDLSVKLVVGVGGSFDVISGKLKRAPVIFRRLGCEWFYRLIQEPSRITRMRNLALFVFEIFKLKFAQLFKKNLITTGEHR